MKGWWFEDKEIVVEKQIRLYGGPELPFIEKDMLYFSFYKEDKDDFEMDDRVEIALEEMGECWEGVVWEQQIKEKVHFKLDKGEKRKWSEKYASGYLVGVKMVRRKGNLCCCLCEMRPYEDEYTKAYYRVPLNEEAWDDWICPECTL